MRASMALPAAAPEMINSRSANIFKQIFEAQKIAQKQEKSQKDYARNNLRPAVYHGHINYNGALREKNGLLTRCRLKILNLFLIASGSMQPVTAGVAGHDSPGPVPPWIHARRTQIDAMGGMRTLMDY